MRGGLLRNQRFKMVLLMAMLATANVASADSMRCGKWVVSESTGVDELLTKCGQPQSKDVTKDDVYLTNANGRRVKTDTVTVTERWIYQPSPGALPMEVVIVDGKVLSLTRTDR